MEESGGWIDPCALSARAGRVSSASADASKERIPYVIIRSNKVHVIITNHSLGLSALDPLPSALEIDVEEDPVVDVCRRSERRDRSPVLF